MNKEVNQDAKPAYLAHIAGCGSSAPTKKLTNEDLSKMVDTSDEWITTRTGIKTRYICSDNETTALLATQASKQALDMAGLDPCELDLIIVATVTPEMVFPSTACFVQKNIEAVNARAFDLSAACSGFIYSLSFSHQFIASGKYKNALLIGAYT
ncbi:MAG: 3-oxoacyl-ACP synthase, partial [Planctomycetes bacterium]|nr:3-oxoacyl-ACP synthase [Planctomycetota bacterium]